MHAVAVDVVELAAQTHVCTEQRNRELIVSKSDSGDDNHQAKDDENRVTHVSHHELDEMVQSWMFHRSDPAGVGRTFWMSVFETAICGTQSSTYSGTSSISIRLIRR